MGISSIEKFDQLREGSDVVFALVFRGHWCPFCMSHIRQLAALEPAITKANGAAVIITAEPEAHLSAVRSATGYRGEAINDPQNSLVKEFKNRYSLDVAISDKGGYEHGMAQPAILLVKKDGTVLERWAIVPRMMNIGGAKDRPNLSQVWDNALAKMAGNEVVHQSYATSGVFKVLREKISG